MDDVAGEVRRLMTIAVLKQLLLNGATAGTGGRVRFNLLNGWMAQRLLFENGLERKPVSLAWFRVVWPLLWQRKILMPLVGPKGIYFFYSDKLIRALAREIEDRTCLELAFGDGTLSRFLEAAGVDVTATDDHSWTHAVTFPASVVKADARELREHDPQVVVCSWPPPDNDFEREVFATPSVEAYIVISSRHRFAAGDWSAYETQQAFTFEEDRGLSKLVLPPELEAAVYVFQRERFGSLP